MYVFVDKPFYLDLKIILSSFWSGYQTLSIVNIGIENKPFMHILFIYTYANTLLFQAKFESLWQLTITTL